MKKFQCGYEEVKKMIGAKVLVQLNPNDRSL